MRGYRRLVDIDDGKNGASIFTPTGAGIGDFLFGF